MDYKWTFILLASTFSFMWNLNIWIRQNGMMVPKHNIGYIKYDVASRIFAATTNGPPSTCKGISISKANTDQFTMFRRLYTNFTPVIYSYGDRHVSWGEQWKPHSTFLRKKFPDFAATQLRLNMSQYSHVFRPVLVRKSCGVSMSVTIYEEYLGNASRGGSGFKVSAHHVYGEKQYLLENCPVLDHNNGTYKVECQVKSDILDVTIRLNFVDYNAYKGLSKTLDKVVYRMRFKKENYKQWPDTYMLTASPGWHNESNVLKYVSPLTGITYPLADHAIICKSLENETILGIGASHMSIFRSVLAMHFCPSSLAYTHVHVKFMRGFNSALARILHNKQNSDNTTMIFMQTGIWDLAVGPQSERETHSRHLDRFMDMLQHLLDYAVRRPLLKIVLMSTPARRDEHYRFLDNTNNHNVDVFNALLEEKLSALNKRYPEATRIRYFDMFQLTRAVAHTAKHHVLHYADCNENITRSYWPCWGESGLILTQLAAYDIFHGK